MMPADALSETFSVFEERKEEIEFYYGVLKRFEQDDTFIQSGDNVKLQLIMKSNFILMLYNLIEACINKGFEEISEKINNEKLSYGLLADSLQNLWAEYKIVSVYNNRALSRNAHTENVKRIIKDILEQEIVEIKYDRKSLNVEGNLDARKIKSLCQKYSISHRAKGGSVMKDIKEKRNFLAHGDIPFSNSSNLTILDLENYKNDVFAFMNNILTGMKNYCEEAKYKKIS